MQKLISSIIFTFSFSILLAQKPTKIPFRLTNYNNIVIKTVLNNQDSLDLMFHTGMGDVTVIEAAMPKLKSIKIDGKVDGVKSWGGSDNSSDYSVKNHVKIGDIEWQNMIVWKDKYSGQETDGKVGLNLFDKKVLAMDFDENQLIISTKLPRNLKKYEKFELNVKKEVLFIKAILQIENKTFEHEFMIHSGYAGDILLDDKFSNDNQIGQLVKIIGEKKLKDSYGNEIFTKKGVLPAFKFGKLQLENIPIGFFEGTIGRQQMSIIGGDVLKRFNWIIDAERKYVYLKPNGLFNAEFAKF